MEIYGFAGLVILGFATLLWLFSLRLRDSGIVDLFWGAGFVFLTWFYFFLSMEGYAGRQWLLSGLVTLWGGRLTLYLLWRNWGEAEDFRYQVFRRKNGAAWWWQSFFKVFLLQGAALWIVSAPLLAAQLAPTPARLVLLDYLGLLLWAVGFIFEAGGDWQLARFKANPANKGKLLRSGLWRYTRHPNYFGDALQWWGFFLIAAAAGGWYTIFSPIIMTIFLMRISGVTLLEKHLVVSKPAYQTYMETTSAFLPWPPRRPSK